MKRYSNSVYAYQYDQMEGRQSVNGDVEWYLENAKRLGSPILELGCGSGRISIPIVEAGFDFTGVDLSEPLIGMAEERLTAKSNACYRFVVGDVLDFEFDKTYQMIFFAYNSLAFIYKQTDRKNLLQSIYSALADGGAFLMDMREVSLEGYIDNYKMWPWSQELPLPDGRRLSRKVEKTIKPDDDCAKEVHTFRVQGEDGQETVEACEMWSSTLSNQEYLRELREVFDQVDYSEKEIDLANPGKDTWGYFIAHRKSS